MGETPAGASECKQIERTTFHEAIGFVRSGLLLRPPVFALGPELVIYGESAPKEPHASPPIKTGQH